MFLRLKFGLIVGIFLLVSGVLADSNQLLQILVDRKPEGWGDSIIIDSATGDLDGDSTATATLYSYQIGEERDRNHWQYLIVSKGGKYTESVQVGGGSQFFFSIEIENQAIHLNGKRRNRGDAMAELSQPVEKRYVVQNQRLVELEHASSH